LPDPQSRLQREAVEFLSIALEAGDRASQVGRACTEAMQAVAAEIENGTLKVNVERALYHVGQYLGTANLSATTTAESALEKTNECREMAALCDRLGYRQDFEDFLVGSLTTVASVAHALRAEVRGYSAVAEAWANTCETCLKQINDIRASSRHE